ncbi:MAG TPA: hypothetical protein VLA52_03445 [Thermohalobaculum sp.]|nr:hypothetical protein [Thermohalobaculum sp.]
MEIYLAILTTTGLLVGLFLMSKKAFAKRHEDSLDPKKRWSVKWVVMIIAIGLATGIFQFFADTEKLDDAITAAKLSIGLTR